MHGHDRLDDEGIRARAAADAEVQVQPFRGEIDDAERAMHLFAQGQKALDGPQYGVILDAERERFAHRPGRLGAWLQLRMKASMQLEGNDRVEPQSEPAAVRLEDRPQLTAAPGGFVPRGE